jgi:hypothetical protein
MVAIAVSLSAALFVSSTGYLSGLTNSLGNEQPGQNLAAQTLITIESTSSKAYGAGFPSDGYVVLYVRNVGGVSLTLGSLTVTAPPTNAGQTKSFTSTLTGTSWAQPSSTLRICSELSTDANCNVAGLCLGPIASQATLTKVQNTARIWIAWCSGASSAPKSGDAFQIQVSTTVGASNIVTINVP